MSESYKDGARLVTESCCVKVKRALLCNGFSFPSIYSNNLNVDRNHRAFRPFPNDLPLFKDENGILPPRGTPLAEDVVPSSKR